MKKNLHFVSGCSVLFCLLFLLLTQSAKAQLTNFQKVTKKCYAGPTVSMDNTTGTLVGNVVFNPTDIPIGHRIVEVIVEVVWSKTDDGSCTSITGVPADLSHVGFAIQAPFGPTRYLAASALTGPFAGTSSSFTGLGNIVQDTIVFRDGSNSLTPASSPVLGRDTVRPNQDPLRFYCGKDPVGSWSIGGIDDAPSLGPKLCVHSYCITIVSCNATELNASCKANTTVGIDATGIHLFDFDDLDDVSDVSCLVKDITFSPTLVNCSDVGSSIPVTMTIRDHLDSIKSCVSMVSIIDNEAPVISECFPNISSNVLHLDATGQATFFASDIIVTDNCSPLIKQVRPPSGGPWGTSLTVNCVTNFQQFSVQVTDPSGNVSNCNLIVNVIDTIAPTAVCGQHTAYLTNSPNGAVTVSATDVDGGSFDVCPPVIGRWIGNQYAPPPTYTCADLGIDTVRLIVADASVNLDTCDNAIITILDTIKPIAICKNDTVYLNASGVATVFANEINNNSTDICGIDSININGFASVNFNCSHVNNNQQAILNVFDISGNTDSCIGWITVIDTFPPITNCKNLSIYLDAAGLAAVHADSLNNGSIDLCTGTNLTFEIGGNAITYLDCSNISNNPNLIVLTVIDSFGNSSTCNSFVSVWDTITPLASCANAITYLNNSGIATLSAADLSAGSWDNCGVTDSFVNVLGNAFTTFDCTTIFAPQSATLIVTDAQGNMESCVASVDIVDTIRPVALCEVAVVAQLNAAGIVTVLPAAIDSNSTDNCGLVEYLINSSSSADYTCADLGTQIATLTVRDSSGNTSSCLSQIMIQDNIAPTVLCQTKTVYINTSGIITITPDSILVFPATNDNCGLSATTFSTGNSITYTCDSIGARTVQVLVTDNYGNTSTCITTVTVVDTIAPIASCRPVPFTLQLDSFGVGCVTPFDIDNGSSDLCSLDTMLINGVDLVCFNCNNLGVNTVTLSVLDSSGNQSTCTANVFVTDVVNPTALCHDTTIYLGATGVATVYSADIDAGSSDNCSFTSSINNQASVNYTCAQVGINPVQLTITDNSGGAGNQSQCLANITILDSISPVASCIAPGNLNVYLDASCFASLPAIIFNNGSTDNCTISNASYSVGGLLNATFTAADLATNPNAITLTVTDPSGNSTTCNTSVTVLDTIRPTITCVADTLQLDVSGNVSLLPSMVLGSSIDNCSNALAYTLNGGQASLNYNCLNTGSNLITLTATDSSGNSNFCTTSVFVEDQIAPNASCRPTQILNLNAGGTFGVLNASLIDLGSSDNCTISSYALSQDTFTCADISINPHIVTLTVIDASGNVDSCTTQITVQDNSNPTALCQTTTAYLGVGIGTVSVTPEMVLVPPTGDNCAILTSTFAGQGNNIVYTCDSIGVHTVTVVVTDISGNTANCTTTITVLDTVSPVASCQSVPYTVQLNALGNGFVTALNVDNGSSDFCGITSMLINGLDSIFYTCANVGNTSVTLLVLDASGNPSSCVANIIVNDPINPVALCHDTTLYLDNTGITTITPTLINAGSYDNCSFTSSVNGFPSVNFSCNQVGTNTVQLIITDSSGNTTQCPADVTLLDTIAPTANCIGAGSLTVYLDNTCFASIPVTSINNGSTDNCSLVYTVGGLPNVTFNTTNPNTIVLTVTDPSGNSATCSTSVVVLDTIRPTITCVMDTLQLDVSGNVSLLPNMVLGSSIDNCRNGLIYTLNGGQASLNFSCLNTGSNPITLTATDSSGNSSFCTTSVFVEDQIAPNASCHPTQTLNLNAGGTFGVLNASLIDLGSSDNCTISSYALSQDSFTCADISINPHIVTLTVTDASGNVDSCTTQITVQDNSNPTALCQTTTAYLGVGIGTVSVTPAMVLVPPTGDNCAILTSTFAGQGNNIVYTCDSIGVHTVTVVVTDVSGNTASCITTITVLDTVSPVASCQSVPYTVQLDAAGNGFVTALDVDNGSSDFCGITSMLINGLDSIFYTCANVGNTSVTLLVLDASGNPSSCVANIIVNDPINPVALCHDTTLYLGNTGITTITPTLINAGSYDNCSFTSSVNGFPSVNFSCNQVGTNTVQLIITDNSGNTAQCPAAVTLLDTIAPTANCIGAGNLTVYLDNTCFASIPVTSINNGSTDNCSSSLSYTVGGLPNATFNATHLASNPNQITLVVRDATGNFSTCTTTIIVSDTITPIVACQPDTIQLTGSSTVITPSNINAGSNDNCGALNFTINGQASLIFDCTNLGTNAVTLTGTDINGNTASCSTTIYLEDISTPAANCNLNTSVIIDPSNDLAILQPIEVDNGSIDNCTIIGYSLSQDTFDCSDLVANPHAVELYVVDASGNVDTCTTQVTVLDTISPTAICQNDTFYFSGAAISITGTSLDGGSFDNCALQSFDLSQDTFNCPDIGVNAVTLTVTDSDGNSAICIANVTILDTTAMAVAGTTQLLCSDDSTTLSATAPPSPLVGTWTTNSGATIANPNAANTLITNIPVGTNVFYWTLSNASCTSLSTDSVLIEVVPTSPDIANAGDDQNLCQDTATTLGASAINVSTGEWVQTLAQFNAGVVITDPTDTLATISGLVVGNAYTFVWELTNGSCGVYASDTVIITIDEIPNDQADAGPDVTCSPDTINLAANFSILGGVGEWSTPSTAFIDETSSETSIASNFAQDTTMLIWALSNGVCVDYSIDTMYVILDDVWPVGVMDNFDLIPDGTISTIDVILNDVLPPNWDIFIRTPMMDGLMTNLYNGQFEVDISNVVLNQSFVYEICNTNCPDICDTALVNIAIQPSGDCYTPTAFTPNNDGQNDFFVIPCLENTDEKAGLTIFNRWGNLVFKTDNYISDWDGTHQNQPLPDGVYFYILQIDEKTPQNGSIEIKR